MDGLLGFIISKMQYASVSRNHIDKPANTSFLGSDGPRLIANFAYAQMRMASFKRYNCAWSPGINLRNAPSHTNRNMTAHISRRHEKAAIRVRIRAVPGRIRSKLEDISSSRRRLLESSAHAAFQTHALSTSACALLVWSWYHFFKQL